MIKYSRVHEHIEAQPHPSDPGSRHPGDHSLLLPWFHRAADRTHPQRTNGDAQPYRDIYAKRYTYLHHNGDAQHDAYRDYHKHINDNAQFDPDPDIYPNI
jgi:hypothetical protein